MAIVHAQALVQIMDKYFKQNHFPFEKMAQWNANDLHMRFRVWAETHPENTNHKYISMFPEGYCRDDCSPGYKKTKAAFKHYVDNILKLKRNTKTGNYWIKNKADADRLDEYFVLIQTTLFLT